jgi:nitronate monooxygenase
MWTNTPLSKMLNLALPIVQGPFGGGNSTFALAAAISNAGGLGSFGAVGLSPEQIRAIAYDIAARTSKPFNINLWVPIAGQDDLVPSGDQTERSLRHLRPLLQKLGLADPVPITQATFEAQVEAILEARPPVWSFVMGVPDPAMLRAASARGIKTIGTATTVDEAVAIEEAGADAVVASGSDAGGHRGSFLRPVELSLVGTMSLVPQIASAVSIPVIAAGGIADGRGIAAALALGAHGVQIGTAFLASPESGAPAVHKEALGGPEARCTRLTRAITGRYARGIENNLMLALEVHPEDVLPYPAQHALTSTLRTTAGTMGRAEWLALWAGQNAASARAMPAAEIVTRLVRETEDALGRLQTREA